MAFLIPLLAMKIIVLMNWSPMVHRGFRVDMWTGTRRPSRMRIVSCDCILRRSSATHRRIEPFESRFGAGLDGQRARPASILCSQGVPSDSYKRPSASSPDGPRHGLRNTHPLPLSHAVTSELSTFLESVVQSSFSVRRSQECSQRHVWNDLFPYAGLKIRRIEGLNRAFSIL